MLPSHELSGMSMSLPKKSYPGGSYGEESAFNAVDQSFIPGLGRSPGKGNGDPLSNQAWRIPWTEETGRLQSNGEAKIWTQLSNKHTQESIHRPHENF